MDYYKDIKRNDFNSDEDYLAERVKKGMAAGYTFLQCYNHFLQDFKRATERQRRQEAIFLALQLNREVDTEMNSEDEMDIDEIIVKWKALLKDLLKLYSVYSFFLEKNATVRIWTSTSTATTLHANH